MAAAWEYLTRPTTVSLAELNQLGADGWEVVGQLDTVAQDGARRVEDRSVLLRRPARSATAVTGD